MKREKWLSEVAKFLEYISRNSINIEERKEENLEKKFGIEITKGIIYFCMNNSYTRREVMGTDKKRYYRLNITKDGLKFLEEFIREEKKLKYSKWMFYSSVALIVVTLIYVLYTASLVKITKQQFEVANQPLLESLSLKDDLNMGVIYTIELKNIGNTPAKITEARIVQILGNGTELNLPTYMTPEIFPDLSKGISFINNQNVLKNSDELYMRIEIKYKGEDDLFKEKLLNRSFYRYGKGEFHSLN